MRRIGAFFLIVIFCVCLTPALAQDKIFSDSFEQTQLEGVDSYDGPRLEINVAARQLKLFDYNDNGEEALIKVYPIAVGAPWYPTPRGPYELDLIVWNPWWIPPDSEWAKDEKPTPPGPRNPLGPVKMRLGSAILVHGTTKPNSVGRPTSHGCMRMLSEDALELAWYLQTHVTDQNTEEEHEKYRQNPRQSFYVPLEETVPVNIIYEIAEIREDKLYIYSDVYGIMSQEKIEERISELLDGVNLDAKEAAMESILAQIKAVKNKEDVIFPLTD